MAACFTYGCLILDFLLGALLALVVLPETGGSSCSIALLSAAAVGTARDKSDGKDGVVKDMVLYVCVMIVV